MGTVFGFWAIRVRSRAPVSKAFCRGWCIQRCESIGTRRMSTDSTMPRKVQVVAMARLGAAKVASHASNSVDINS